MGKSEKRLLREKLVFGNNGIFRVKANVQWIITLAAHTNTIWA
jgi:hypothetical protein